MADENLKGAAGEAQDSGTKPEKQALRTMVGDVQEYLKGKKISLAELLIQKSKRETDAFEESYISKLRPVIYGAALILILALAAFGVLGVKTYFKSQTEPKPEKPQTIVKVKEEKIIEINEPNRSAFIGQWKNSFDTQLPPRDFAVMHIFDKSRNKYLNAKEFFSLIGATLPQFLSDSLDGGMNLIIIDTPRGLEPAFIFNIKSFSESFAGMLAWENSLPKALSDILDDEISLARGQNNFQDLIIANHDARALKNAEGEDIFYYAIFNRRVLIFTQGAPALETLIRQLALFPPQ